MAEEIIPSSEPKKRRGWLWVLIVAGILLIVVAAGFYFDVFKLGGGRGLLVALLGSKEEVDIILLQYGDEESEGISLVEDVVINDASLIVYRKSFFDKNIGSVGFLTGTDQIFGVFQSDDETMILQSDNRGKEIITIVDTDNNIYAAVYPDSKKILYGEGDESGARCYSASFSDDPARLGKGDVCYFSLDGSKIFIVEEDDGEYLLTVVDTDSEKDVTLIEADNSVESLRFSSDGEYVAYVEETDDGQVLFVVDYEDADSVEVSEYAYAIIEYAFAPREDYGFFIAEDEEGLLQLYGFNVKGNTDLIAEGYFINAFFGKDQENMIYIVGDEEESLNAYTYSFKDDDSDDILEGEYLYVAVLEDADRVIIADVTSDEDEVTFYGVKMDGDEFVELLTDDLDAFGGVAYVPGENTLFFYMENEDGVYIYVTPIDDDSGYELLEEWYEVEPLNISSDGEYLIFSGIEDSGDDEMLYSIGLFKGAGFYDLDDDAEGYLNAVFTPDGKDIIYSAKVGDSPEDITIFKTSFDGEGRPEVVYEDARLLDVEWDELFPFEILFFYEAKEGTSYCPGAKVLVVGEETAGSVSPGEPECFRFTGVEGEIYTFEVDSGSSGMDLSLGIYDNDGFLLDFNEDSPYGPDPRLTFTVSEAGRFFIQISGEGADEGDLTVRMIKREDSYTSAESISLGDSDRGEITSDSLVYLKDLGFDSYGYVYSFEANEGDRVEIKVLSESIGSELDSFVYLLDEDQYLLASNDDGGSGGDSRLIYTIPATGTYYIVVADSEDRKPDGDFSYEISIDINLGVYVAIFNYAERPSYFFGAVRNDWEEFVEILESDTTGDFIQVDVITTLDSETLSMYDRLVLPDNAVPDEYLDDVDEWFTSDKKILALDSAVCYLVYSGYLIPGVEGEHGNSEYWTYENITQMEIVSTSSVIASGFSVGDIISVNGGDAWLWSSEMPSDLQVIAVASGDSSFISIATRDVPGHGTIIFIGPHWSGGLEEYTSIILNALR